MKTQGGNNMASPTINTLTSFSGADLVVTFANQAMGELQQITYAIQREKAPVFTLGSADARSFSRGKRGIAGSLVFGGFDHDCLVSALQRVWDQIAPKAMFTAAGNAAVAKSEAFLDALDMLKWDMKTGQAGANTKGYGFSGTTAIGANKEPGSNGAPSQFESDNGYYVEKFADADNVYVPAGFSPIRGDNVLYADMLPPFDVTLTFANEYGQTAFQKIYDVDILNDSSGVSVDTVVTERQLTYIARRISPLIRGVYSREQGGNLKGIQPTSAS
jgi:hypothetical protein